MGDDGRHQLQPLTQFLSWEPLRKRESVGVKVWEREGVGGAAALWVECRRDVVVCVLSYMFVCVARKKDLRLWHASWQGPLRQTGLAGSEAPAGRGEDNLGQRDLRKA